jgi:chromosome segregation ATPase
MNQFSRLWPTHTGEVTEELRMAYNELGRLLNELLDYVNKLEGERAYDKQVIAASHGKHLYASIANERANLRCSNLEDEIVQLIVRLDSMNTEINEAKLQSSEGQHRRNDEYQKRIAQLENDISKLDDEVLAGRKRVKALEDALGAIAEIT